MRTPFLLKVVLAYGNNSTYALKAEIFNYINYNYIDAGCKITKNGWEFEGVAFIIDNIFNGLFHHHLVRFTR